MFWLLFLIPLLVATWAWAQRRRRKFALRYSSLSLVKDALGPGLSIRRHIPPALFLLALAMMIVALARPIVVVPLPNQEGTFILAIDVSGSMRATDMQPNRLEAAKSAARAFVERQPPTVRIGVVAFSAYAALIQAPTTDREAVVAAINRLSYGGSTAIGRGILISLEAIDEAFNGDVPATASAPPSVPTLPEGEYAPAIVILLSDGANRDGPEPLEIAPQAARRGIRIYTVGVGRSEGAVMPFQGYAVRMRLDEETLRRIADMTDGAYYHASDEEELHTLYKNLSTRLILGAKRTEITFGFTSAAVVLSLIGGLLSLLWFDRLP